MHGEPCHEGLTRRSLLGTALGAATLGGCVLESHGGFLPIATAEIDGVYFRVGNAIARVVNLGHRRHGIRCAAQVTPGSSANLVALLRRRTAMGLVQNNDAWSLDAAQRGALRVLASLHAESLVLLARPGVVSLDDLPGRRVALGPPGSGHRTAMTALLSLEGWTPAAFADVHDDTTQSSLAAQCAGLIDAVPLMIGHPATAVANAIERCGAHPLPLPDAERAAFGKLLKGFEPSMIPAGTYGPDVPAVATVGTRVLLAAHADLPDRTAADVVGALLGDLEGLRAAHPVLRGITGALLRPATDGPLAPHDGALDAFQAAGMA